MTLTQDTKRPLRISSSGLVGTLELTGNGARDDMRFPVVFYGPGARSRYILPNIIRMPYVPTEGAHAFHVGYNPRTNLRVLMPVKTPDGKVVLADIGAEAYAEPDTIGELVKGTTSYYSENGSLGSDVNALKRQIYSRFGEEQVLLNTDPELQAYFAASLLAPANYGAIRSLVNGSRAYATPVDTLDLTVENTYNLMKQVADEEEHKRQEVGELMEWFQSHVEDERMLMLSKKLTRKDEHGLFVFIGNGELRDYITHDVGPNFFNPEKYPENTGKSIYSPDAQSLLEALIPVDGAVLVNDEGGFRENGVRLRLPDKVGEVYQRLAVPIDLHDGNAVRAYMFGVDRSEVEDLRKTGTKHFTAAGLTLLIPDTAAITLGADDNVLSLIRNGKLEREYRPSATQ